MYMYNSPTVMYFKILALAIIHTFVSSMCYWPRDRHCKYKTEIKCYSAITVLLCENKMR